MDELIESLPIINRIVKIGGYERMTGKEDNIESYWVLVRNGFLKNLVTTLGDYEWKFIITNKGYKYLQSINQDNQ